MTDWIETYLSVRRAALPAAAVLGLGVLLAACVPAEEVAMPPEAPAMPPVEPAMPPEVPAMPPEAPAVPPEVPAMPLSEVDALPVAAGVPEVRPHREPILLNDPAAPVHAGGAPYPHGTFPPHPALEDHWAGYAGILRDCGDCWGWEVPGYTSLIPPHCAWGTGVRSVHFQVEDQLIFMSGVVFEDPEAEIGELLRGAGRKFESLEVRTREYYDERYDRETFINWLSPYNGDYSNAASYSRLGAELHPELVVGEERAEYGYGGTLPRGYLLYQVILHGNVLHDSGVIKFTDYLIAWPFELRFKNDCRGSHELMSVLAGGLYTTFGDDLIVSAGWAPDTEPLSENPILLNDPPAPIHTGGGPYPPGTFPPEVADLWDIHTNRLQNCVDCWEGEVRFEEGHYRECVHDREYRVNYRVKDQLLFRSAWELDDPAAAITGLLRDGGVEFEALTVRTAADYADYDPETFINWLWSDNSSFSRFAAFRRLGAELNPDLLEPVWEGYVAAESFEDGYVGAGRGWVYQVKLHGHAGEVSEAARIFNASAPRLAAEGWATGAVADAPKGFEAEVVDAWAIIGDCGYGGNFIRLLVGGLYTTFGDDLVLDVREPRTAPRIRGELGLNVRWHDGSILLIDPLPPWYGAPPSVPWVPPLLH